MTAMTPLGAPPPPSVGSRQAWPPPPEQSAASGGSPAEDDPWASWYDKPRSRSLDTPSATMPRVPPAPGPGPGYGPPDGADQQYPATQQYPGGQPYPGQPPYDAGPPGGQFGGPQQYGQYGGPQQQQQPGPRYGGPQAGDPQYPGQPYGDPQYGGPQYGDPQYGGPQYGGPQYGDPQYGNPQYADPQFGGPQYGGPPARGGSRLAALRSRGPLIPIAAIGAVAIVVVVAVVLATSSHNSPSQTASQGGTGATGATSSASQDAAQQAAATQLSGMLKQSGAFRADVNAAVGDVESCQRLRTARTAFGESASNRENLLSQLRTLPGRATLPAALLRDLTGAWTASIKVDNDLHNWAQDKVSGGCNPKTVQNDPNYQASLAPDGTASTDKQAVASDWAPIAAKYGLPAYTASQI